jgi:hypothetical protein
MLGCIAIFAHNRRIGSFYPNRCDELHGNIHKKKLAKNRNWAKIARNFLLYSLNMIRTENHARKFDHLVWIVSPCVQVHKQLLGFDNSIIVSVGRPTID